MASFDDYDEFGNYIGADLDSDEEEGLPQNQFVPQVPKAATLEGYDDEQMQEAEEGNNALMEIDGSFALGVYRLPYQRQMNRTWL